MKNIITGFLFAALWGTGSVVIKFGLTAGQPLVLMNVRFAIAALLMLLFALLINKDRYPKREEWLPLFIGGILSMTIYVTAFVFAMKQITAGIGTLGIAANPLIITVLNLVWLRQKITKNIWVGLFMSITGIAIATYPLLIHAQATFIGVALLGLSMICYSVATVYYQSINWTLPRLSINGWQVFFGGLGMLPFTLFFYEPSINTYNSTFWLSVFWMVIPVSIISVQLWLYLLKAEPIKASLWLFLCPIFGFFYAAILLHEPITIYTLIGTSFVILGLYLGKKSA
ncbi:MAG: DMT family transporter [Bacteroidia bacterium]